MGRKLATFILPAVVGYSSATLALGLGGIEADSSLNEPLSARIPLVSATEAELENLRISLGSAAAFERAGVARPFFLNRLQFEVITDGGSPYVKVTTADPVKEPFLDFLVEARWPQGRLLREYTILINPPLYAAEPAAPATRAPTAGTAAGESRGDAGGSASAVAAVDAPSGVRESTREPAGTELTTYGPVGASDTLWEIANEVRPGDVTVNQAMLALLRTNPDAFIENNINRLRRGAVLRVPGRAEMTRLTVAEAMAEVSAQIERWQAARGLASAPPPEGAASGGAASAEADPTAAAASGSVDSAENASGSQLTVVAPQDSTGLDATASSEQQSDAAGEALDTRLALLEETNASLESANADLRAQVESLKRDLARLESMINLQMQESVPGADAAEEGLADVAPGDETASPTAAEPADAADPAPASTLAEAAAADAAGAEQAESGGDAAELEPVVAEAQPEAEAQSATPAGDPAKPQAAAETRAAAAEPAAEAEPQPAPKPDLMALLMHNSQLIAGGGGAVLLLLLALLVMRRRRAGADDIDDLEPMPAPGAAPTAAAVPAGEAVSNARDEHDGEHGDPDLQPAAESTPAPAYAQGDPLEQAEVFIALGNFEKAQAALDDALGEDPDNRELRFKLLEVLAERGDRGGFEAEAQVFHTQVDSASDPLWTEVVRMGRRIAPEHPLFGDGDSPETPAGEVAQVAEDDDTAFDLEPEEEAVPAEEQQLAAAGAAEFDLDFELDADPAAPAAETPRTEFDSSRPMNPAADDADDEGDTDFDLDFVLDEADRPRETDAAPVRDSAISDDTGLDFELPEDLQTGDEPDRGTAHAESDDDMALDFGDLEMAQPEGEDEPAEATAEEDFDLDALDEAGTKLDLARAYIDMGDADGARSLLEEVMEEGNSGQKQEAENLLRRAG